MTKYLRFLVAPLFLFVFMHQAQAQMDAGSTWVNQRGSVLTIAAIASNGQFTGTYVNNAGGFACQGTPYDVIGWIHGVSISWIVNWTNATADCNSETAWGGVALSTNQIHTQWVLSYQSASGPQLLIGYDDFNRQ